MRASLARLQRRRFGFLGDSSSTSAISQQIQATATAQGVPPQLALSVAQTESSLNPNAVSSAGAQGLFQLMPGTAAAYGVTDAFDPTQNMQAGIAYLSDLFQQFGDWATALAAYNWGPTNVIKYGAAAAPASTQNYVSSILAASGPTAAASTSVAPLPGASSSADDSDVIDVPYSVISDVTSPASSVAPNLLLLAMLGLGVYLAADVLASR